MGWCCNWPDVTLTAHWPARGAGVPIVVRINHTKSGESYDVAGITTEDGITCKVPSIKYSAGDDEVACTVDVSVDGLNFSIWENLKFTLPIEVDE